MQIEKKKKKRNIEKAKTFRAGATDWRGCVLVSDHELWRSAVRVFSFLLGMRIDLIKGNRALEFSLENKS